MTGPTLSTAINPPDNDRDLPFKPWYRYGWPWFLISIPFVSMALGGMMLYLGLTANNSLVVDDYYKEGKAINQRIDRDRTAALLGLHATLRPSQEGLILEVAQRAPELPASLQDDLAAATADFRWPETLQIRWVHVTQAERDGETLLQSLGGERYLAPGVQLPGSGRFRIHIQPRDDAPWRLFSKMVTLQQSGSLSLSARLPEEVFGTALFGQSR
ncbi:MAG: FixH family protein [Granulosicoccus sp.]|nr:FixH family protein [Granulosicoccus sp.]